MSNITLAIKSAKDIARTIEILFKTTILRIVVFQNDKNTCLFECYIFIPVNNFGQIYDNECCITNSHYEYLISYLKENVDWEFDYLGNIQMSYRLDEEMLSEHSYVSSDSLIIGDLYEKYKSFNYAKLRFFLK
jgi:hypothetical protein